MLHGGAGSRVVGGLYSRGSGRVVVGPGKGRTGDFHGRNGGGGVSRGTHDTPEETLAQTLEAEDPVLCPDCGEVLQGVLESSEELPVEEQPCRSMVNGTDAVYKLSLTYDWQCAACGYTDPGQTVEGTRAMVCHGWTS